MNETPPVHRAIIDDTHRKGTLCQSAHVPNEKEYEQRLHMKHPPHFQTKRYLWSMEHGFWDT